MKDLMQFNKKEDNSDEETRGKKNMKILTNLLGSNLVINVLISFMFVFMEWLFITTKPSFLSASSLVEKINVLLVTSFLLAALLLLISIPALLICSIFPKQIKLFAHLLGIIPAAVLASLALLLIDNFTYTVLKFGIVDSHGITSGIYLLIWIGLFVLANLRLAKHFIMRNSKKTGFKQTGILATVLTITPIILVMLFIRVPSGASGKLSLLDTEKSLPNIVLFTADGVNAKNMSVYGYERETTPFLDSIKDSLIISTNHFNNAANTSGSITSILTGKYPSETRVLFPPDLLKGGDSLEHVVAILRDLGYYSSQLTISHYVDASNQNLQNGFNESNGVSLESNSITNFLNTRVPGNTVLFVKEVEGRLFSRLKHIFFIETMQNTFEQITETQKDFKDLDKVYQAVELINQNAQPVFVQIHWMGTHGDKFYPESTKYSAHIDRDNQESWNEDLYDDAIVDVDSALQILFDGLNASGELDSTLIIISSDHGKKLSTVDRLPMIIHLPAGISRVLTIKTTQHVDIAPTILDILGQPQPSWMNAGRSIFAEDYPGGLVLSVGTDRAEDKSGTGQWTLREDYFKPPFYQFDYMTVIDCDRYYRLNLEKYAWSYGEVSSYVGACSEDDYLSKAEIRIIMVNKLIEDGFEFDQNLIPEIP
jgi:arylsulfatase A-like enzyme